MSSRRSATPLRIELRPSRQLATVLVAAHAGGLAVTLPLSWPWWGTSLLGMALAASLAWNLSRHALLSHPRAVWAITWRGEGDFELSRRDGTRTAARLAPDTYVHPRLVILCFRRGRWGRSPVVLCRDAVDQESFRRLRVRLGAMAGEGR